MSAFITEPSALNLSMGSTNADCTGSNGAAAVRVRGGVQAYSYIWTNGQTTTSSRNLSVGQHCVTVTDANGCFSSSCVTISPSSDAFKISKTTSLGLVTTITVGSVFNYIVTIKNTCSGGSGYPIQITDVLPAGLQYISATASSGSISGLTYTPNNGAVNSGTVAATFLSAPLSDAMITITVRSVGDAACITGFPLVNTATAQVGTVLKTSTVSLTVVDANIATPNNCTSDTMSITFGTAINAGILAPVSSTAAQTIVVNGTWTLDRSYTFAPGSIIKMESGARIVIPNDYTLTLNGTVVESACSNCMWHEILVQGAGRLISSNSRIEGAQYAIEARNTARLNISNTTFIHNFIGIYTPGVGSPHSLVIPTGSFVGNVFDGGASKKPFVGLVPTLAFKSNGWIFVTPIQGAKGFAGIYMFDNTLLNLTTAAPSNSNTFRNLMSGIVAYQSHVVLNCAEFKDILPVSSYNAQIVHQGGAVHSQGVDGIHTLQVYGMMTDAINNIGTTTFNNCHYGIKGIGVGMNIYSCGMADIPTIGIQAVACNNRQSIFKTNRIDRALLGGIFLYQNELNTNIALAYNYVLLQPTQNSNINPTAGIFVQDTKKPYYLTITQNRVVSRDAQIGIAVVSHQSTGGAISNNEVEIWATSPDKAGIFVMDSEINLTCNNVIGTGLALTTNNIYGIYGSNLSNNTWLCNTVDNTQIGVCFQGTNDVQLRGTRFDNHDIGLLLTSDATIGVQGDDISGNGNRWLGNANQDAVNMNNANLLLSKFTIDSLANPQFKPNNFASLGIWFENIVQPYSYDCNTSGYPYVCGQPLLRMANIDQRDISLATDDFVTASYTETATHNGKRQLYRKLKKNPALGQANMALKTFEKAADQDIVGHLDNMSQLQVQALNYALPEWANILDYQMQCSLDIDTLLHLDSLLASQRTSQIESQRDLISKRLSQRILGRAAQDEALRTLKNTYLENVALWNDDIAIDATILPAQLEQELNAIYFQMLSSGHYDFNANQLAVLRLVAAYCPEEGGIAVHRARAMLTRVQLVRFLGDDCAENIANAQPLDVLAPLDELKDTSILLYPNPTMDKITLYCPAKFAKNTEIVVVNALGQSLATVQMAEESSSILLDVSTYTPGVYVAKIRIGQKWVTKSFVVVK